MYCTRCGKELEPGTKFCPNCGEPVRPENQTSTYTTMDDYASNQSTYYQVEDKASIGYCIISFLFPFMGVIFYFMQRRMTPHKAKACLYTGLISFALNVLATFALMYM